MSGYGLIAPTHRAIRKYYEQVGALRDQRVLNEMNVRSAFEFLLADTAKLKGWTLIPELSGKSGGALIRPDGTLRDRNSLPRGYWEAKDTQDDLDTEIKKKIARGYPLSNIIFEDTQTGVLFQSKQKINGPYGLGNPKELAALLNQFFSYTEPDIEGFEEAVDEFKERVPDLARGLVEKIQQAHKDNARFQAAFEKFFELCRTALNPNIRVEAVDEMLVQHLLTERLFRTIFNNPEFVKRNAIAAEVERVIDALVSHSFDRTEYQKSLDRFYVAIESAARLLPDFSEKQHFLNTVYERFFQGYAVKVADTHGIVYTPQEIVNFMCASVAEVLEKEFGKSLSSADVFIIDPCTGTGNFIVNLMRRMSGRDLPRVYREQLFANEVMLLPYYIASLNIEHAYYELTGGYESFEGLCFVDTLDLAEGSQHFLGFMTEKNAERVDRERKALITVVIGNPPYNANQLNENDNNKNRKYPVIDKRIQDTYAKDSKATLKNKLYDPYVKFFRWAIDRLGDRDGIVCLVTNNNFVVNQYPFDGFRKHLQRDFAAIYHVDLHGNIRRNPKLSGTTHNVFGIKLGVGITVAVKRRGVSEGAIRYFRVPELWRKEEKLGWLITAKDIRGVAWELKEPTPENDWLIPDNESEFGELIPLGERGSKSREPRRTVFEAGAPGVETCRDEAVYDFGSRILVSRVERFIQDYNAEVDRFKRSKKPKILDDFFDYTRIKWSSGLKLHCSRGTHAEFHLERIRPSLYRPFTKRFTYYDHILNDRPSWYGRVFPNSVSEDDNIVFCCTNHSEMPFSVQATNHIPNRAVGGRAGHCFPFYVYDEDGTNRQENITDWALEHFRKHYNDKKIAKWDIFYYVYGVLHHPEYRSKYAENLKRELPRIPLLGGVILRSEATKNPGSEENEKDPSASPQDDSGGESQDDTLETVGPGLAPAKAAPRGGPTGESGSEAPSVQGASRPESDRAVFWAFAEAGKELARLHIEYESLEPYPLKFVETLAVAPASRRQSTGRRDGGATIPLSYRVEDKMRLSKDRRSLKVNDSLTLGGIPPEAFEYRLGNRSALEWVIDQYQVTEDKHSGIRSDPNRADDPEYIVRLVGQVIRVSLETVKLVKSLPAL